MQINIADITLSINSSTFSYYNLKHSVRPYLLYTIIYTALGFMLLNTVTLLTTYVIMNGRAEFIITITLANTFLKLLLQALLTYIIIVKYKLLFSATILTEINAFWSIQFLKRFVLATFIQKILFIGMRLVIDSGLKKPSINEMVKSDLSETISALLPSQIIYFLASFLIFHLLLHSGIWGVIPKTNTPPHK